ncbi:hypothetical protein KCM76_24395 [Zooshikella marina]|uniref:hypothetical protein n=1 Tax=Zooshikella ganghwensis TaxID=202772 RepID=UPI001BAF6488|nr:hypothetical protein [Zooshikella ganghwensis]MBU2709158.1 hypothetical protein [Zooshikella ganghwensis]
MHQTRFKILKDSRWGIVIDLKGDYSISDGSGLIHLDLSSLIWISGEERFCLERAIDLVGDKLKAKIRDNKDLSIIILGIEFNPCDFQVEGLTWALVQWVSEVFEIDTNFTSVTFNKADNRYEFFV